MEVAVTNEQAGRRYYAVLIPGTILFLALCIGVKFADDSAMFPDPVLYALGLIPAGLLIGAFWAQWRYINEIDEVQRSIHVKAAFVGLAVVMTAATGWGFLELFVEVPRISMFWLNPLYWIAYSFGVIAFSRWYATE
jgi:hypothetical protein